jgi:Protein of unknown function (DUF3300)
MFVTVKAIEFALAREMMASAAGIAHAQTPSPTPAPTQTETQTQPAPFKPEEIEALVAPPVALYPDSVLAQVPEASTYPLEIVHAARGVKANPNVKGDAAV